MILVSYLAHRERNLFPLCGEIICTYIVLYICARTKGYYWTLVGPWIDYRFDSTRSNGLRHLKDRIIGRLDLRGVLCFKGGSKRRSRESVTNVAPISLTLVYK